jgi:3,4-dihydroxy 2-butanone 4-phosphate synthase / GTP cyclohydrolase II
MRRKFARVEEAIEALAAGRVTIVVDSEDRENEGDFVAAAEAITPQTIHLMVSEGRGQLCMPVMPELAQRLQLTPMVPDNGDDTAPRFTVPVDHRKCSTGISPLERAFTIRAMLDPANRAEDFVRPGHIFPLVARPEGVLRRTGHTEAAVDLARLADLQPAGVLCEICSRDGLNMARRDELMELAAELQMPIVTIDDLVEFRRGTGEAEWNRTASSSLATIDRAAGVPVS